MWRVAEPNEALIISGLRHQNTTDALEESLGFKIITGKGTLVFPGVQVVRRLSLDLREADLAIECVTHQGIPLGIRGVVIYKVGDDFSSIANAARRFLDQQAQMDQRVHNVFTGHLRAIVGNMTVEEMIRDREKLTQLTRESSGTEMEKLGLIVDSLQIQEIEDPTGYIKNLGRPHAAAVESQARIAQADADRLATEKEQEAEALKAEARRTSQVKQAGYSAEVDQAAAIARQAGPKSEAQATQEVVVEQTKVAELEAQREEQRLQATVRKPADAKAYETVTLSRAERDSRIAQAEAEREEVAAERRGPGPARQARGRRRGRAGASWPPPPRPSTSSSRPPPEPRPPATSARPRPTPPRPRARPRARPCGPRAWPRPRPSRPGPTPWPRTRTRSSASSSPRTGRPSSRRRPSRSATSTR